MKDKIKVLITFREGRKNGGPYVSHQKIINSALKEKYQFVPLFIPEKKLGIMNFKALKYLKKQIKEHKPDIIHVGGLQTEGYYGVLSARLSGFKNIVLTIHGSGLEAENISIFKRFVFTIIEKITIKLSKDIVGVSDYIGTWKRMIKSKKYKGTIYNIPNLKPLQTQKSIREELNIGPQDIIICSTGRITIEKGYQTLLKVIKKIDNNGSIHFVIAGDGDYLKKAKQSVIEKEIRNVHFLGYRNDIGNILLESDIFVLCTKHETLSISIIEAGFFGIPSVVSNVGGIPEIIIDGENGYLVEPSNIESFTKKLESLIENKDLRERMGKNAKRIISEKFSEEKITSQIDELYKGVLK